MINKIVACAAAAIVGAAGVAGEGIVLDFPANGNLEARNGAGQTISVAVTGVKPGQLTYLEGRAGQGQGVYLPNGSALTIPLNNFNPRECTISFWYRPDWAPGDCTTHTIVELKVAPGLTLSFRKGASETIAPDYSYVLMEPAGACSFGSDKLFTARTWRHYAVRWSAERAQLQFLVDGYLPRSSAFKTEAQGPTAAALILGNNACGAFAQVRVFDRWLENETLLKVAGLNRALANPSVQQPPPGGMVDQKQQAVAYVDTKTGKLVEVPAGTGGTTGAVARAVYNPARMPMLPQTEHTDWAKPLAGGPVRALMIMDTDLFEGSMLREGVELWQRLDLDCEMISRPNPEIQNKEYDVIIVSALQGGAGGVWKGWQNIAPDLRAWVLDRVRQGRSGLILAYPLGMDDAINGLFTAQRKIAPDAVLRGFPASAMHRVKEVKYDKIYDLDDSYFEEAGNLSRNVVECYQDEKIRAVKFNYVLAPYGMYPDMGLTPDTAANMAATDAHYDYWQALLARAVLFAAGRTNGVTIANTDINAKQWQVTLTGESRSGTLWYRGRDIWGRILVEGETKVKAPGIVTIEGTDLPPRAVADFIVKDKQGNVLDWYSSARAPAGATRFTGIVLNKAWYAKSDTVKGVANVLAGSNGVGSLEIVLGDHQGRNLVKTGQSVTLGNGSNAIPFQVVIPASSDSLLMRVDARLMRDGRILDARSADCPVPCVSNDGFYAGGTGCGFNRFTSRQTQRLFRDRFHMNLLMGSGNLCARDNLRSFEYMTHLGYPGYGEELNYDMTSPEHWENFFPANLRIKDVNKMVPFHPLFYSLGEEHFVQYRSFRSPTCTPRFQDFVKKTYGSIDKLNAVWGTNYTGWNEVQMLTPESVDMQKIAFNSADFINRRFMEHLFAERHAYLAQYFRKIDAHAEVGIHCGWDLWMGRGYDYWLLSRGMESMIGYADTQMQYIRSFFKNCYGCWYHYAVNVHDNARWVPWYMLISGARGFGWFILTPFLGQGATTADLHLSSDWLASCDEYVAAKTAGDLLARAQYQQDRAAIHYSQDSFQAGVANLTWIHNSFVNLCYDKGVPFRFVSYEQVADGELVKQKYSLFILPHSISLSDKEIQALRVYLAGGGVVWADIVPGGYNQYGQKLPESQVKDWFEGMETVTLPGGKTIQRKKVGRGEVILADIGNYNYDRNVGRDLPTKEIIQAVMERAGIQGVARVVQAKDGSPVNGVWQAGYRNGAQRYVVMNKDYQIVERSVSDVNVLFPAKAHVYEMRSGKYYGYTDEVRVQLEPTRGKVFSLLPYRVKKIAAERAPVERGKDLALKVSLVTDGPVGSEDTHLLHVSVNGPDGNEVTALRRQVMIHSGQGEVRLPVAFNDPPGKWEVMFKDTATGLQKKVRFNLE